jgi:hypothetical protein
MEQQSTYFPFPTIHTSYRLEWNYEFKKAQGETLRDMKDELHTFPSQSHHHKPLPKSILEGFPSDRLEFERDKTGRNVKKDQAQPQRRASLKRR